MPVPRSDDRNGRHGDKWGSRTQMTGGTMPQGRTPTDTEAQRRRRHGIKTGRGIATLVWAERNPRLALPFKPYVYRGTGADAYTGEVVE